LLDLTKVFGDDVELLQGFNPHTRWLQLPSGTLAVPAER
jgi:hypothetical protein